METTVRKLYKQEEQNEAIRQHRISIGDMTEQEADADRRKWEGIIEQAAAAWRREMGLERQEISAAEIHGMTQHRAVDENAGRKSIFDIMGFEPPPSLRQTEE